MRHNKPARRGILLLLILSLLAMFGMVAVAFVVLSSQSGRSAKHALRDEQTYHPPQNDLNEGIMNVLRGSVVNPDPTLPTVSKLAGQSLLEDLYGANSITGTINAAGPVCGGQLTEITLTMNPPATVAELRRRVGCVLTVTGIPNLSAPNAKGLSTRIVGLNPTNGNLQIVAFPNILPAQVNAILQNNAVLINGAPFAGTGFGLNPLTGRLNLWDYVNNQFLPVPPAVPPDTTTSLALLPFSPANSNPLGGANEDYDAPDYQNMLMATPRMAYTSISGNTFQTNIPSMHRPALVGYWYQQLFANILPTIEPGFAGLSAQDQWKLIVHPYGVDYDFTTTGDNPGSGISDSTRHFIVAFKRNFIGRPLSEDHPHFNGSNPLSRYDGTNLLVFNGANVPINVWERGDIGRWDVDNDGDGIPDSIWIDIGLPVRTLPDGRRYKPLVAILCLDMDGRLNLNAHGNLAQTQAGYYIPPSIAPDAIDSIYNSNYFAGAGNPLLRGRGYGPAEINLASILPIGPGTNYYQQLLSGNMALGIEGRYGFDLVPGDCINGVPQFFGNNSSPMLAANTEQRKSNDYLSANKWFEFDGLRDSNAGGSLSETSAATVQTVDRLPGYAETPDPSGRGVLGVDPAGRPILQGGLTTGMLNLPYELNLNEHTSRGLPQTSQAVDPPDNPFSVNELERILRPYDRDATSQSNRLAALTNDPATNKSILLENNHRDEITTESSSIPACTPSLPPHLMQQVQNDLRFAAAPPPNPLTELPYWYKPKKVTDLLRAYLYYQLRNPPAGAPYIPLDPIAAEQRANLMVDTMTPAQLLSLFPPELLAGLKMDINHPFPGYNDLVNNLNYNMAVLWKNSGAGGTYGRIWAGQMPDLPFPDPGAVVIQPGAPFAARQLYARYLYILALLLRDPDFPSGADTEMRWPAWYSQPTLTPPQRNELTKRRLAQWAINVACYKSNDSVMVPFEYDDDPFGIDATYNLSGWRFDGIIGSADDADAHQKVVWGSKPPELILTETLGIHNLRIADTRWEKTGGMRTTDPSTDDSDYDQTRIPQGSAFFELYCPRDLHGTTPPKDLYYQDGAGAWHLDLGRLAPAPTPGGLRYPVWRMVISESILSSADNNIANRLTAKPDSLSLEPNQERLLPNSFSLIKGLAEPSVPLERIVWFANQAPTTHTDAARIYYNRSAAGTRVLLDRGNYVVVGPRQITSLGLSTDNKSANNLGDPCNQSISIPVPNPPYVTNLGGTPDTNVTTPGMIKTPLGIIVAGGDANFYPPAWPAGSPAATNGFGINISEPLFTDPNYYTEPTVSGPNGTEWYGDPNMTAPQYFLNQALDANVNRPLGREGLVSITGTQTQTISNYKTVFLQRLANPSASYDPVTNPYRTVDWLPIDLTIFNGEDSPEITDIGRPYFATHQRGLMNITSGDIRYFNPWTPQSDNPDANPRVVDPANPAVRLNYDPGTTAFFKYNLVHSVGYLNQAFWNTTAPLWIDSTIATAPSEQYGDPNVQPFPWMPWFGRPYANPFELMMVPTSHPARLLWEFQPCTGTTNHYNPGSITDQPFPQLMNFLQSNNGNNLNQFHRILDYVGVPSKFVGTEIQANPLLASNIGAGDGEHWFHSPYNNISTYREPGKMNANTIFSPNTFSGWMNVLPPPVGWNDFLNARCGDGLSFPGTVIHFNDTRPSEFSAPFRSHGGSAWTPQGVPPLPEIDGTLLRPRTTGGANPLPLFDHTSVGAVDDINRNPYFRYSDLMRLGNLTTTQSNVYSVWITVGYFEVSPVTLAQKPWLIDQAHLQQVYPDGCELGQELGTDTGEIERHRGFYIIDRSIPVGFQRGQDTNVEKAILLKRFIE